MIRIFPFLLLGWIVVSDMTASEDLVTLYRQKGMAPIEKKLDTILKSKAYWREALKTHAVKYGYFDDETDLLLCSKTKKQLRLYHADGRFYLKESTPIVVGKLPGDKKHEGDMRTPLGVYKIVARRSDPGEEYGPLAFVTDYPNRFDKIFGKDGHGIWLHGFPYDCREKNATKGCIALKNDALLTLDKKLDWKKALLIISDQPIHSVDKEKMAALLTFLFDWRYDWKYNRLAPYLSHYDSGMVFKSKYGFDYFKRYKTSVFKRNRGKHKTLRFNHLQIVPYPNALGKKLWYVAFHETYAARGYRFDGTKTLLVEEVAPERFKIVVE